MDPSTLAIRKRGGFGELSTPVHNSKRLKKTVQGRRAFLPGTCLLRLILKLSIVSSIAVFCTVLINSTPAASTPASLAAGAKVYLEACASCHMADGSGVSGMQPTLDGDAVVAGDPNQLIRLILLGPTAVLPTDRPVFSNTMPAFNQLTDQQVADLLNYIRQQYGGQASEIEPNQVAEIRTQR
jgi:mono/diheme cytochrome c family protein